jgi:RND superfamily putative drug exporter
MSRRRAALLLLLVLLGMAALGIVGGGVEAKLEPTSLTVPGTRSAMGQELMERTFGPSSPFTVLLRGPVPALERQGPRLVAALRRSPEATVLSPWDRGAVAGLRPEPRRALVLIDVHVPLAQAMRETVPELERTLGAQIHPPVEAVQSGYASVSRGLQQESLDATERAELIAAPLLLLFLLLVFRSVVAAAIPLAFGALTVAAGRGVLVLLGSLTTIDGLSVVVCTMMGLALGVDYSLFIVSRFREELAAGAPPGEAALRTRRTAGRTTAFAGLTLFVSILLSAFLQPGSLLASLATALVVVAALSVLVATVALPALLALIGHRIDALSFGGGSPRSRIAAAAAGALRRPALTAAVTSIPLLLLAAPALALNTGAPGVDELSASNPARQSAEAIDAAVGPGWEAPFVLVAEAPRGPITSPRNLRLLARWQRRIAAQPGVRAVVGPGAVAEEAPPLQRLGAHLVGDGQRGVGELGKVGPGLREAAGATRRLRRGLARAGAGSGLLAQGAQRAARGAGLLAAGLEGAAGRGGEAVRGIARLSSGTRRLAKGQRETSAGALTVALGLRTLLPAVTGSGLARARRLARELEAEAREDPSQRPKASQARALARVLSSTRNEVRQLREQAGQLNAALNRLVAGGNRLETGTKRLSGAAGGLMGGLRRLGAGAGRLASGLGALEGGAGTLQRKLAGGFRSSYPLQAGLARASVQAETAVRPILRGVRSLRTDAPHLFDSGYFVLSALEGARPAARRLAGEAVNLEHGGQAARLLVVSTDPFNTAGSREVGARLIADADRLATAGGLRTGVTGGAATLNDYGRATKGRLPLVIGAIVAVTFLLLVVILRALPLAGLAVLLNLGSVAAAVGVMTLVCRIPAGYPLGGHPYIDTVGAAGIFGVTFGLSIDYAVFLLARMRERYDRDGDNEAAIRFGLEKTAAVITGAAAIMTAVFVSFAAAPIATVSQMGVGLMVAILLDATIVRIVLLPALMLLLGDRVWWMPAPLERVLPRVNVHGARVEA